MLFNLVSQLVQAFGGSGNSCAAQAIFAESTLRPLDKSNEIGKVWERKLEPPRGSWADFVDNETPKQKVIQSSNARSSRNRVSLCILIITYWTRSLRPPNKMLCCVFILYCTEWYLLFKTIVDIFVNLTLFRRLGRITNVHYKSVLAKQINIQNNTYTDNNQWIVLKHT